jgi:hypothetical protein
MKIYFTYVIIARKRVLLYEFRLSIYLPIILKAFNINCNFVLFVFKNLNHMGITAAVFTLGQTFSKQYSLPKLNMFGIEAET